MQMHPTIRKDKRQIALRKVEAHLSRLHLTYTSLLRQTGWINTDLKNYNRFIFHPMKPLLQADKINSKSY